MSVHYLKGKFAEQKERKPRRVSFFSPIYRDEHGHHKSVNINIDMQDGDVEAAIAAAIENGGIGLTRDDGVFYFVPWPCAAIEIQDL